MCCCCSRNYDSPMEYAYGKNNLSSCSGKLYFDVYVMCMTEFPLLSRLNEAYEELPAFQDAMPKKQPDTPVEERG
ncbi:unnamed protein product [Ilex paraguariensis]|uniref:Uncharacterized protein n=1 Tax=Ilex paraguariensis TaxID=185542 RepID=A0ABC8V5N3_9AQUA